MKYNAQGNNVGELFHHSLSGSNSLVGKVLNAISHIPGVKGSIPAISIDFTSEITKQFDDASVDTFYHQELFCNLRGKAFLTLLTR